MSSKRDKMTCGDQNRPFTLEIARHVVFSPLDRKRVLKNSSDVDTVLSNAADCVHIKCGLHWKKKPSLVK